MASKSLPKRPVLMRSAYSTFPATMALAVAVLLGIGVPSRAQVAQSVVAESAGATYVIGFDDIVEISVWNQPTLSGKYTVEADGVVKLPLVGPVGVAGLKLEQAERLLETALADGFVKEPHVAMKVDQARSQQIFVTGEVKQPGSYPLTRRSTLLEALARAGSVNADAGAEVIVLRKPPSSAVSVPQDETIRVDLEELQSGNLAGNIELRDGDTILVPKAETVFVTGSVRSPGAYPIRKGMTVLQALALAGGITERGSDSRIRIIRFDNGKKKEVRVSLEDPIQRGDTIVVRERIL